MAEYPKYVTDFVQQMKPLAAQIGDQYGIDPALIITQAAIETGWGRDVAGNNYFGVKSHGQPGGQSILTHEEINGQKVPVYDNFRQYGSLYESMNDYGKFLSENPRYSGAFSAKDLGGQIDAIAGSGYATDSDYGDLLKGVSRMVTRTMGPTPPASIPNVVASLTDTVPPRPPAPVAMSPDLSLMRNPQMSAEARQAQVTPSGNVPLPRSRPERMGLHPFDPNANTPRPNADGSISTEITRTVQLEDGSWANVPSLWWGSGSSVRDFGGMTDDQLAGLSARYEQQTGQKFPRYKDLSAAESAAVERSAEGGGTHGGIARPELPRPAQNGVVRGSAIADSIGRNPIPGGSQMSPMFDAAYDTRTGQMRMMPGPMATAGMAYAATPAPAPIPAPQATQYPPMRLPDIPSSNLGQPPVTRSVPSIPMNMAPTQAEIDRAPGQVIATYPTTARPIGSASGNIRDQRSEQMAQRPPLIPDRLTPGTAAQNYDVALNGPAGLTREQFAALPGQTPLSQPSMLPRIAAPMPVMRPSVQMPMQQAARPQAQRPQYSPLRIVVQGANRIPMPMPASARPQTLTSAQNYDRLVAASRGAPSLEDRVSGRAYERSSNSSISTI